MNISTLKINMSSPISILIGENGCGKSTVLSELARTSVHEKNSVIAIATSVYDKFPRRNFNRNFHYMGGRLGRYIPREAIKQAISKIDSVHSKDFSAIFRILDYVGYSQTIGFKVSGLEHLYDDILDDISELNDAQKELVDRVLYKLTNKLDYVERSVIWFNREHQYDDVSGEFLIELLSLEVVLKKYKLIKSIDIYLSKQGQIFPLTSASSGELSLISTLVFISSFIEDDTLILIDEPENSLHPKWQKEYISMIMDVFSYYNPSIVAATHSPMVISGLHKESDVDIHKYTKSGFIKVSQNSKSAEGIYEALFDIITPASRELSNQCAEILNSFSDYNTSLEDAYLTLNEYIDKSYDEQQITFINGVKDLLIQINNKRVA